MRRRRLVAASMLALALALGACGDDGPDEPGSLDNVQQQAKEAAEAAGAAAGDAWASLRTDGERLVDKIQSANDPKAKEELLDRCRDALEKLRKVASPDAERVDQLCNRIRDTDVNDRDAWTDIGNQINQIDPGR